MIAKIDIAIDWTGGMAGENDGGGGTEPGTSGATVFAIPGLNNFRDLSGFPGIDAEKAEINALAAFLAAHRIEGRKPGVPRMGDSWSLGFRLGDDVWADGG
jgi:hypothetical protein